MTSSRRSASFLLAGSLAGLLVLAGCGSDDDPAAASASGASSTAESAQESPQEAPEDEPITEGDTCAQAEELGATGASWGPVQAWLPKADLLAELDGKLAPMQDDVVPPGDHAEAWAAQKGYLEALQAAAEQLPEGGRLSDPALIAPADDVTAAQTELTDWWFATCR
ncbi:hypothetical protein [Blastococcus sp. SYSU D01042]